jgi:hypothetical protein
MCKARVNVRIIRCNSGLPEQVWTAEADFIGDRRHRWVTDEVYRVVCEECGLVDKAATRAHAIARGDKHARVEHGE